MLRLTSGPRPLFEASLGLGTLLVLLVYTSARFQMPSPGFLFDTRGRINAVSTANVDQAALHPGDQIVSVGAVTWTDYKDRRLPLFGGVHPGETVTIQVLRAGQTLTVPWSLPVPTPGQLAEQSIGVWPVGYAFWLAGVLALHALRPRDARWLLLVAFNFVTAVWIVAGSASATRLFGSATLMRVAIWLCVPIYLHLHWLFPTAFGRLPGAFWAVLYLAGLVLAAADAALLLPSETYFLGFVMAVLGSLTLLIIRYWRRPGERADLRLMAMGAGLAMVPAAVLALAGTIGGVSPATAGLLLGLPALPFTYLYVIHRRRLGGLEVRVNRAISLYLFLVLLLPAATLVAALAIDGLQAPGPAVSAVVAGLAALAAVFGFERFQVAVERQLLAIPAAPARLLETFAARIATRLDRASLAQLLSAEVLPGLLIRQSALLLCEPRDRPTPIHLLGVEMSDLPAPLEVPALHGAAGQYRPTTVRAADPWNWIRLVLPMWFEGRLAGVWLLGRRDPDDFYSAADIQVLQALADQMAIALQNISQAEHLHALYRADIDRTEVERASLARELHDGPLNQLSALLMKLPPELDTPGFIAPFRKALNAIRATVSGLRPAMLDSYGLYHGLHALADEIEEVAGNGLRVEFTLSPTAARLDPTLEMHVYRIVQQACVNAAQHARASCLRLEGYLSEDHLELDIRDDGIGFAAGDTLDLSELVAKRHYGLAGMAERAGLIGASLSFNSHPGAGTCVRLDWPARVA